MHRHKIFRKDSGFGLLELLAVLGVLAIIMAVAMPNFLGWRTNAQLRSVSEELRNAVQLAKSTAVKEGQVVVGFLRKDSYLLFVDKSGDNGEPPNWQRDPGERILTQRQLPENINLEFIDPTTGDPAEAFRPEGRAHSDRLLTNALRADKWAKENKGVAGGLFPVDGFRMSKVSFVPSGGEGEPLWKILYDGAHTGMMINVAKLDPGFLLFYENGECATPVNVIVVNSAGEKLMIEITNWIITKIIKIS